MLQTNPGVRQGDPAIKWLVGGTVVAMGGAVLLLMFLADELKTVGPSGVAGILGLGLGACAAFGAVAIGPVGRAIGKRILGTGDEHPALDEELHDLRMQVDDLRSALTESQERIDFTERLLAGGKDRAEELH